MNVFYHDHGDLLPSKRFFSDEKARLHVHENSSFTCVLCIGLGIETAGLGKLIRIFLQRLYLWPQHLSTILVVHAVENVLENVLNH